MAEIGQNKAIILAEIIRYRSKADLRPDVRFGSKAEVGRDHCHIR